MQKFH